MKSFPKRPYVCGVLLALSFAGCNPKPVISPDTLEDKADGRPPEKFAEVFAADITRWGGIIRRLGLKAD